MKHSRIILWSAGVTAGLVILTLGGAFSVYAVHDRMYADRIFPGVRILDVDLGGLTASEADQVVHRVIDERLGQGLRFRYQGHEVTVDPTLNTEDPDASRDLVVFETNRALNEAFTSGRTGPLIQRALAQARLRLVPKTIAFTPTLDRETLSLELTEALKKQVVTVQDAAFVIVATSTPPAVYIQSERTGVELRIAEALDQLEHQMERLDTSPIDIADQLVSPRITQKDIEPLIPTVEGYLQRPMPVFTYESRRFSVSTSTLATWISVTGTPPDVVVTLNPERFGQDLGRIAPGIEQEAKNGSLVIKDGKIDSFVSGQSGLEIDRTAMLEALLAHWPASSTFPLVVHVTESTLTGEDPERLGIRELLGVGRSNFSGSPVNRRKNIALGIARVNGSIIQPGATFSLLTTLGPVDGVHGWLPELVIKGNETKPEFGGGLCQIGTTTFRGALAAGLPIVERKNHSYRVRYYEPAGTDATIYEPKPDFRFLNDTAHPILIHAYAKGDEAIFEFWGTKDGRKAEQTKPRIYNITAPPSMKLIETIDLPVGTKKCTETAHAGADAEFTYTVSYPNGEVKTEVFRSHYRPWQAVCLIGVEKLSQPAGGATSTIPVTP